MGKASGCDKEKQTFVVNLANDRNTTTTTTTSNLYELFGLLFDETVALSAPAGALQVQSLYEVAKCVLAVHQFIGRLKARHQSEQSRLVQWPAVTTTRRLDYSRQIRLGNVQPRQPHHLHTCSILLLLLLLLLLLVLLLHWRYNDMPGL